MLSSTVSTCQRHIAHRPLATMFVSCNPCPTTPLHWQHLLRELCRTQALANLRQWRPESHTWWGGLRPPLVQDQRTALSPNTWQCYKVLVNVVSKSPVSPQLDLATLPTTKVSFVSKDDWMYLSVIQFQVYVSHLLWPILLLKVCGQNSDVCFHLNACLFDGLLQLWPPSDSISLICDDIKP